MANDEHEEIADLLAFLKARIDEDEHAATRASSLCGCHPNAPSWVFGDETTEGRILVVEDPHPQVKRKLNRRWGGSYDGLFMAQHIVRHDPARVLREVEAKRQLVDLHQPEPLSEWDRKSHGFALKCAGESWECYGDGEDIVQWPCDHLKLLALAYADHPDYREEWKP